MSGAQRNWEESGEIGIAAGEEATKAAKELERNRAEANRCAQLVRAIGGALSAVPSWLSDNIMALWTLVGALACLAQREGRAFVISLSANVNKLVAK